MKKNQKQDKKEQKGLRVHICIAIVLTITSLVFAVLCIYGSNVVFLMRNSLWLSIAAGVLLLLLCALALFLLYKNKEIIFKTFISGLILLLFCLIVCFILQKTGFFNIIKNAESLQAYLETAGAWMSILYVVLQYLQVVVLPIPSIVSTVAGIALFGAFWTMIYSLIGIILGSITAFFIGRKLGNKAVVWLVGDETLDKWQKKVRGKDNLILTLMFILPLFPDDVLCFLAGLSSMSWTYFLIMIFLSRILAVSATCYSFDFIPFNTWWGLLIWGFIIVAVVTAFILIYKYMDKIQSFLSKRFKVFRKKNK